MGRAAVGVAAGMKAEVEQVRLPSYMPDYTKSTFSYQLLKNQIIQGIVFLYYHWGKEIDNSAVP